MIPKQSCTWYISYFTREGSVVSRGLYPCKADTTEKVAVEAQNLYYQHLFNTKENSKNSIKKLWNILNMVCSFKNNKTKTFISKIVMNSKEFTDPVDICNEFNRYFCNVGEELVSKLPKDLGKQLNFMNFCNPSAPHSMACESIDRE